MAIISRMSVSIYLNPSNVIKDFFLSTFEFRFLTYPRFMILLMLGSS